MFPTNDAEHLFVATTDGSLRLPLESDTSRSELCSAMTRVLCQAYKKDPSTLFKELHALADQLDLLDAQIKTLTDKRAALMESRGAGAKGGDAKKKVEALDAQIAGLQKQIADKNAAFQKSSSIELKPAAPAKEPAK